MKAFKNLNQKNREHVLSAIILSIDILIFVIGV
jgi:hypothetical protein